MCRLFGYHGLIRGPLHQFSTVLGEIPLSLLGHVRRYFVPQKGTEEVRHCDVPLFWRQTTDGFALTLLRLVLEGRRYSSRPQETHTSARKNLDKTWIDVSHPTSLGMCAVEFELAEWLCCPWRVCLMADAYTGRQWWSHCLHTRPQPLSSSLAMPKTPEHASTDMLPRHKARHHSARVPMVGESADGPGASRCSGTAVSSQKMDHGGRLRGVRSEAVKTYLIQPLVKAITDRKPPPVAG